MDTWLPETRTEQKLNVQEKELCVELVIYKDILTPLGDSSPLCSMYTNKEYRFRSQNTTSIRDIYFI